MISAFSFRDHTVMKTFKDFIEGTKGKDVVDSMIDRLSLTDFGLPGEKEMDDVFNVLEEIAVFMVDLRWDSNSERWAEALAAGAANPGKMTMFHDRISNPDHVYFVPGDKETVKKVVVDALREEQAELDKYMRNWTPGSSA